MNCPVPGSKGLCNRELSFSVAYQDGSKTYRCPGHGLIQIDADERVHPGAGDGARSVTLAQPKKKLKSYL